MFRVRQFLDIDWLLFHIFYDGNWKQLIKQKRTMRNRVIARISRVILDAVVGCCNWCNVLYAPISLSLLHRGGSRVIEFFLEAGWLAGWAAGRLCGWARKQGRTRKIFVLSGGIMEHLCRKLVKFCGLVPYPRSMISKINNVDPWIQYWITVHSELHLISNSNYYLLITKKG